MSNQLVFIGLGDRTPLNWLVPPIHPLDGRLKAAPKTRRKSIDGRVLCRQSFVSGALSVPCRVSVVMATIFLHILCAALLQSSRAGYTAVGRTFISRKERRRIPTNCTSTTRRNEKERQKRRSTTLNDDSAPWRSTGTKDWAIRNRSGWHWPYECNDHNILRCQGAKKKKTGPKCRRCRRVGSTRWAISHVVTARTSGMAGGGWSLVAAITTTTTTTGA